MKKKNKQDDFSEDVEKMDILKAEFLEFLNKYKSKSLEPNSYLQIENKEKKNFRRYWWEKQGRICPLLGIEIPWEKTSLDHMHKRKSDEIGGDENLGLIRGVLHMQANSMEGKVYNSYKRLGLNKFIDLPSLLRNIANYIENPPIPPLFIYPSEKVRPKKQKLGMRQYKKVCKYYFNIYPNRHKLPQYPKSGEITKEWSIILQDLEWFIDKKEKDKRKGKKK